MSDKKDWPYHAWAAWEHQRRRGDRLYEAFCRMECERDEALRRAEKAEAKVAPWACPECRARAASHEDSGEVTCVAEPKRGAP